MHMVISRFLRVLLCPEDRYSLRCKALRQSVKVPHAWFHSQDGDHADIRSTQLYDPRGEVASVDEYGQVEI